MARRKKKTRKKKLTWFQKCIKEKMKNKRGGKSVFSKVAKECSIKGYYKGK